MLRPYMLDAGTSRQVQSFDHFEPCRAAYGSSNTSQSLLQRPNVSYQQVPFGKRDLQKALHGVNSDSISRNIYDQNI